jgi:exopolysaccharide biosynthesis polyprenyl glycosylphosphotransferase
MFVGALMIALHKSIPELKTPLASSLLAVTVLLLLLRPIIRETQLSSHFRTRVLLIGNGPLAKKFVGEIEAHPKRGYTILGLVEETSSRQTLGCPYLVLGTITELQTIVGAVRPDRIVLALSDRRGRMPTDELLKFQLNGIIVEDVAEAYERFSGKLAIEAVTPGELIASQRLRQRRALKAMQRMLSFVVALIGLLVLAPILALIALVIKLDTGGPVLFRQTRLGRGARPFHLIKFRTMQPVENPTSEWAQDNLDRITGVGRWLRRFRLDELPQLVNVIYGDMNLVGPRPHPVCNFQLFREQIPYYAVRCSVLPGITGWAQTRYRYANNLEQETEKMRYDLYYIMHMSLWRDLSIILDTFRIFVSGFTRRDGETVPVSQPALQRPSLLQVESGSRHRLYARSQTRYTNDADSRSTNLMESQRL